MYFTFQGQQPHALVKFLLAIDLGIHAILQRLAANHTFSFARLLTHTFVFSSLSQ